MVHEKKYPNSFQTFVGILLLQIANTVAICAYYPWIYCKNFLLSEPLLSYLMNYILHHFSLPTRYVSRMVYLSNLQLALNMITSWHFCIISRFHYAFLRTLTLVSRDIKQEKLCPFSQKKIYKEIGNTNFSTPLHTSRWYGVIT